MQFFEEFYTLYKFYLPHANDNVDKSITTAVICRHGSATLVAFTRVTISRSHIKHKHIFHNYALNGCETDAVYLFGGSARTRARALYYAVKYHLLISFIARRVTINYSVYFDVRKL